MDSCSERRHWSPVPAEWVAPLPLADAAARDSLQKVGWEALQERLACQQLWLEVALLEKLMYKNKSQHRGAAHFKRMQEVIRNLRLLRELCIPQLVRDIGEQAVSGQRVLAGQVPRAPSRQAVGFLLCRLHAGCQLVEATMAAVHSATRQMFAQIAMSYFMPLALSTSAAMARVNELAGALMGDNATTYNLLVDLLPRLPSAMPLPADAAALAARYWRPECAAHLPHMLKCHRAGGLAQLRPVSFPDTPAVSSLLTPVAATALGDDEGDIGAKAATAGRRPIYTFNELEELPVFVDRGPTESSAATLAKTLARSAPPRARSPPKAITSPPCSAPQHAEKRANEAEEMTLGGAAGEAAVKAVPSAVLPKKPLTLLGRQLRQKRRADPAAATFLRVEPQAGGNSAGKGAPGEAGEVANGDSSVSAAKAKRLRATPEERAAAPSAAADIFAALLQ
eukprot:jgi/Tetstr1/425783/TSEL_001566.t1